MTEIRTTLVAGSVGTGRPSDTRIRKDSYATNLDEAVTLLHKILEQWSEIHAGEAMTIDASFDGTGYSIQARFWIDRNEAAQRWREARWGA